MSKRATNTVKIFVGLGRMISGTSKTMQAISQMINSTAVASHGMAILRASRRRSLTVPSSWGVLLRDAVAQLVNELDEMWLEGRGQRARPRDVDVLAEHD